MINNLIIIKLNGVHKEEQKTLKKYLEYNCWDWTEINQETFRQSIVIDDNGIPKTIDTNIEK